MLATRSPAPIRASERSTKLSRFVRLWAEYCYTQTMNEHDQTNETTALTILALLTVAIAVNELLPGDIRLLALALVAVAILATLARQVLRQP